MAINSLSASSYGLSGLVSGIDTQTMVEKMLSGTQAKIDKKNQEKSVLQMKQQLYRDVAAKLKSLQDTYLSFTSGTNLLSSSFYNTMNTVLGTASGVNAAFSVTATSNASAGSYTMNSISQLATARTYRTQQAASGDVKMDVDRSYANQLLQSYRGADARMYIKVGNEEDGYKEISIGSAPETFAGKSPTEVAEEINKALKNAGVNATASYSNNKLKITAENSEHYVTITGNTSANSENPGLAMLMFGSGNTNLSGKGSLSASIDTDSYMPGFEINLDGRTQTINIGFDSLKAMAAGDNSKFETELRTKLKNAFGSGVQLDTTDGWKLVAGTKSQNFKVTGNQLMMDALGMKSGVSNKLNTTMSIKNLNLSEELQGNKHTFTINGVQFSYDSSATISNIIGDINASKAGVKISYLESEDIFVIQNSETGAGSRELEISQEEGNLLTALFGVKGASAATGYGVQTDMVSGTVDAALLKEIVNGGSYTFNMNGSTYKFNLTPKTGTEMTAEKLAEALNDAFADSFGVKTDGTQNIEFIYDKTAKTFIVRSNDKDYNISAVPQNSNSNTSQLGFTTGQSTLAKNASTTLEAAGIDFGTNGTLTVKVGNDIDVTIDNSDLNDPTMTMQDLATLLTSKMGGAGTVTYDTSTGAFQLTAANGEAREISISVNSGLGSQGLDRLFGQESLTVNAAGTVGDLQTDLMTDEGQNAKFVLNGNAYERASNNFTIDGLTFTLTGTTFKESVNVDQLRGQYEADKGTRDSIRAAYEASKGTRDSIRAAYEVSKGTRDGVQAYYESQFGTKDQFRAQFEFSYGTEDTVRAKYVTDNGTRDGVQTAYEASMGARDSVQSKYETDNGTRDVKVAELNAKLADDEITQEEYDAELAAYDDGLNAAFKAYDDGLNAALKTYDDGLDRVLKDYNEVLNIALKQYDDGLAAAFKEYDDGLNAVLKEYDDGLNAALKEYDDGLTAFLSGAANHDKTSITVTRDTEKIVEGITGFLKQYNETMDYLYELLNADATYKNYAPLTSAQKAEMTDREIELWEANSKEGLLRNDTYLQKIVSSMRTLMYSKPEGSSIAIYDLGITTSFYTNDGNLNPKSLDDLRAKIEEDPEAIMKLFAGDDGLMSQLDKAISEATRGGYSNPGYLTQVAGSSSLDTTSTIYKQLDDIDEQLINLENRYWSEYNRYWKQFNTMEQLIQQMNTQSSWLSQLSG